MNVNDECCFHARLALVQELADVLKSRGHYVPDSVYKQHSDIIGLFGRTVPEKQTTTPQNVKLQCDVCGKGLTNEGYVYHCHGVFLCQTCTK